MTSSSPRILVALRRRDEIDRAVKRALPGVPWTYAAGSATSAWQEVQALLVGSVERELGAYTAAETPGLRFVQTIYTGLDGFPFERFPLEVGVAGNVGGFAPFVAEHAVALVLAASRAIVAAQAMVRAGQLRPAPAHRVLLGRTAVVLGFGAIGREVGRRLSGLGMRVVGVNRTGRMGADCSAMYPADRLHEALSEGDVVVDARPLTKETIGSLSRAELDSMPAEAIYVNVGRAGTVDEEALYRHLRAHPGFRAGLDVWWEEDFANGRLGSRFPFAELENFVGTPHCAGTGSGVERFVLDRALENVARYFRGETPRYLVDRREYAGPSGVPPGSKG